MMLAGVPGVLRVPIHARFTRSLISLADSDATANNLAEALSFSAPDLEAPRYKVPSGPFGAPCPPFEPDKWTVLAAMARDFGWPV